MKNFPVSLGILIGFTPAILLSVAAVARLGEYSHLQRYLFVAIFLISLLCCVTSSAILFTRNRWYAILGGILLLLVNLVIVFFSGCCAVIKL